MTTTRPIALGLALALAGCAAEVPDNDRDEWDQLLEQRVVDYSAALRIASLRLTGELPTLAEIMAVADAAEDRRAVYEAQVQRLIEDPRFTRQMMAFWQDTLKMGGTPALDSAPAFIARLAVENRPYTEVFTATAGTCPQLDPTTGQFVDGDCNNLVVEPAGLLTHPGAMAHFISNFGFRRVRWVQETFACKKFPAELALAPTAVDTAEAPYTGTFAFDSIAGLRNGGRVDFLDTSSVICANCHSNMNHIAPLYSHFDAIGNYYDYPVVPSTLPANEPPLRTDYLPDGEPLAWRHGMPITGMTGLGQAMAADRDVAACVVARLWNWALGKPDIVDTMTTVPTATIQTEVDTFVAGGQRLRDAIYRVYTSDDFVRF